MPAFYLTLLATVLAGFAARDQVTVAGLTLKQGARPGVLIAGASSAVFTGVFAAWAAKVMLDELPTPARPVLAAIALGLAGLESMVLAPRPDPREPTNSLGALLLVLLMHQATDAARFVVFGLAVGFAAPVPAAIAGIAGSVALISFAWRRPDMLVSSVARRIRRMVGVVLACAALAIFLSEIGMV